MKTKIRTAAVIGSGVMGGGIAALLAAAGVKTLLLDIVPFDLDEAEKNDPTARNRIAKAGLDAVLGSSPALLMQKKDVNRIAIGKTAPVIIKDNVWIGDSSIVCKGVTIGTNSIIGAGAVVVDDVPANVIAAGNPARIVKQLDTQQEITTRAHWFANPQKLFKEFDYYDRVMLRKNSLGHWLRHVIWPRKGE